MNFHLRHAAKADTAMDKKESVALIITRYEGRNETLCSLIVRVC